MNHTPCINGGRLHAWEGRGLDTLDDVDGVAHDLVSVRRCVWCQREDVKPYGDRSARWRVRTAGRVS